MDFKIGYNVKPKEVTNTKQVIFEKYNTGGEPGSFIDVLPTKNECEAYGFVYAGGKCRIILKNTEFIPFKSTIQAGKRNNCYGNSDDSLMVGIDNTILSNCNNNLVVGNYNYVNQLVNNSITLGNKADTTATNSIVLGGNAPNDILGERQAITLMYGRQTDAETTKASYLNNINASYFYIPLNTAMYFHADILALRVGGTHATGSPGDFASWVERGVVINKGGTLSIERERDTIKSSGTVTNWRPTAAIGVSSNFYIAVRGHADMIIEWASTINFTQIKTTVDLTPR